MQRPGDDGAAQHALRAAYPRRPDPLMAPAELLLQGGADSGDFDPTTATHAEALKLAHEQQTVQLLPGQAVLWLGGRFDVSAAGVVRWRRCWQNSMCPRRSGPRRWSGGCRRCTQRLAMRWRGG